MDNSNAARRLVLWAIELNEFDIRYHSRTLIKAQALADFIAKFTTGEIDDWRGNPMEGSNIWIIQQACWRDWSSPLIPRR